MALQEAIMYISNASKLKIGGSLSNGQAQKVCLAFRNKKGITSMLDILQNSDKLVL